VPHNEIILDYASPRPRGKLRLPARSLIRWEIDPQTQAATITATLAGKENAIAGLCFGFFTFLVISTCATVEFTALRRYPEAWPFAALCAAVAITELVLMILIVDQTWAKTTLEATRDHLRFITRSPLRRREMSWHEGEVLSVRLESTQEVPDAAPLGQIQIATDRGMSLTLFVDHLHRDLLPVTQAIHYGLGRTPTPPAPDHQAAAVVPNAEPNEETFNRLVDVHRQMRRATRRIGR
jgi:hypothetical protein